MLKPQGWTLRPGGWLASSPCRAAADEEGSEGASGHSWVGLVGELIVAMGKSEKVGRGTTRALAAT